MKFEELAPEWAKLYNDEQLSFSEIAKRYNTTTRTVNRTLQGLVTTRPKSAYEQYAEVWKEMYLSGQTKQAIGKKYGTSASTVMHVLKRHGIEPQTHSSKHKYSHLGAEWKNKYEAGSSLKEISDEYQVNIETIRQYIEREGGETRSYSESIRKYNIDDHYFDQVDEPLKAYHLGLVFGVGTLIEDMHLHMLNLSFQEANKEIAEKLIAVLGETSVYQGKKGEISIRYISKHLFDTLIQWGLRLNKDKNTTFPKLPDELISAFVLGYWEGRGTYPNGSKLFVSFSGSHSFLSSLCSILEPIASDKLSVQYYEPKDSYRLRISKRDTYTKVLRWMYHEYQFYTESRRPPINCD